MKGFLDAFSEDQMLFDKFPLRQFCVYLFIGVLDPVERVDLVEDHQELSNRGVLWKSGYVS